MTFENYNFAEISSMWCLPNPNNLEENTQILKMIFKFVGSMGIHVNTYSYQRLLDGKDIKHYRGIAIETAIENSNRLPRLVRTGGMASTNRPHYMEFIRHLLIHRAKYSHLYNNN